MKVINRSRHYNLSQFRAAIEFCARHCPFADETTLILKDRKVRGGSTGGLADCRGAAPVVTLTLSRGVQYPVLNGTVPQVGEVRLESLVEEVVLVLGHEFRHVVQFRSGLFWEMGVDAAEIDAEVVGQGRLEAWKRR